MRILVIEDEARVARVVLEGLKASQFAVDWAEDGQTGLDFATLAEYDLVILDLGLPKVDGLGVLRRIREQQNAVPVLILSGQGCVSDRVRGLDAGADDYLVKPFSFDELLARINALLRRPRQVMDKLSVADLELDRVRRSAVRGSQAIPLTQKEYMLLEYLMRNAGRPVTRSMVVEHVWNLQFEGLTNIVDVYINYLRCKIDRGSNKKLIHTVRGVGYMLGSAHEQTFAEAS